MNQQNPQDTNAKKGFWAWLAEHPTIKLIGAIVAILGGLFGIITFLTGFASLPEILARLNNKYYDSFENPYYDGSFNSTLWERGGNHGVLIEQRDGALVMQTVNVVESSNIGLFPRQMRTIPFNQFHAMQAKLKLGSSMQGPGFIKTQVYTIHDDLNWWLECQLEMPTTGKADYFCNVEEGNYNGDTPLYAYQTKPIAISFDRWYLSRMEVDKEHKKVRFYLDYALVGEYTFAANNTMYFASVEPQIGSWVDPSNKFLGYFDDLLIQTDK